MQFDARTAKAFEALAAVRAAHQSALATTVEEVRGYLETHRAASDGRADSVAAELGVIGGRHIDTERFAALVTDMSTVDAAGGATIEWALDVLSDLAARPEERFIVSMPSGADLYATVARALADGGRAFGAARVVSLARNGEYRPSEHETWLEEFPFAQWTPAERQMAPPLVIELDGADLQTAGLAVLLDGNLKIVLVVRGEAPPAPLVRLITPGVFIAQSTDDTQLARLAEWKGSGLLALMPRTAARFVHDPAAGADLASRLTVTELPSEEPKARIGRYAVAQQAEELAQLKALGAMAAIAPAGAAAVTADPVDKLAAWLLNQADLSGVE